MLPFHFFSCLHQGLIPSSVATSWKRWFIFLILITVSVVFQRINRRLVFLLVTVNCSLNSILVLNPHNFLLSDLLKQLLILTSLILSRRRIPSDHINLFAFLVFTEHLTEAFRLIIVSCLNTNAWFVRVGSVERLGRWLNLLLLTLVVLALVNHILLLLHLQQIGFTTLSLLPESLQFLLHLIRMQIVNWLVNSLASLAMWCMFLGWQLFALVLVELGTLGSFTGTLFSCENFTG